MGRPQSGELLPEVFDLPAGFLQLLLISVHHHLAVTVEDAEVEHLIHDGHDDQPLPASGCHSRPSPRTSIVGHPGSGNDGCRRLHRSSTRRGPRPARRALQRPRARSLHVRDRTVAAAAWAGLMRPSSTLLRPGRPPRSSAGRGIAAGRAPARRPCGSAARDRPPAPCEQIRSRARGTRRSSWRTGTYSAFSACRSTESARGPLVERPAGQQVVEQAAQAEDVGPGADPIGATHRLLGAHVGGRAAGPSGRVLATRRAAAGPGRSRSAGAGPGRRSGRCRGLMSWWTIPRAWR